MKTAKWTKASLVAIGLFIICGTASSQPRHWRHCPHHAMTWTARPSVCIQVNHHISQKERYKMALGYMERHGAITAKEYARMTGLSKKRQKRNWMLLHITKGGLFPSFIRTRKRYI